jgi:hypothetical protein
MKRMIFRASRGCACFDFFNMSNPSAKENSHLRQIFLIIFPGSEENILMNKLIKICDIFNASRYKVPSINEFSIEFPELQNEIFQKQHILSESKSSTIKYIREKIGEVSY